MLYIVGTPIGNSEDITLRAVKTLVISDIILAEDTQSFANLYTKVQELFRIFPTIKQQIISFHVKNEFEKLPWIIEQLESEKTISLVSESGLPTISDPGGTLVKYLTKRNIEFTVIPGPNAFTTAAILSGFPTKNLLFLGFLPKKKSQIIQLTSQLNEMRSKYIKPVVVFYESPHRINQTLDIIAEQLPNVNIAIAREMTKKFEEVIRGKAIELAKRDYKGELTVVIGL